MYSEYILTLPGGFELPVMLIKESVSDSDTVPGIFEDVAELSRFTQEYLKRSMIAGSIHSAVEQVETSGGVIRLTGLYACTEMIGRRQNEMIGENDGKSDGADRERGSGG